MKITVNIPDDRQAGLDHVVAVHNAAIIVPKDETLEEQPDYTADAAAYISWLLDKTTASYVQQANEAGVKDAIKRGTDAGLSVAEAAAAVDAAVQAKGG